MNARSLIKHIEHIRAGLLDGVSDIVILTESWLHQNVGDSLVYAEGYETLRYDRQVESAPGKIKRGGGGGGYVCISRTHEIIKYTLH